MDDEQAEAWVDVNASRIFIRVKVDGRWQTRSIAETPEPMRSYWRGRMVERYQAGVREIVRLVDPADASTGGSARPPAGAAGAPCDFCDGLGEVEDHHPTGTRTVPCPMCVDAAENR